jgi:catalase
MERPIAYEQLNEQAQSVEHKLIVTTSRGAPMESFTATLTSAPCGEIVLQDTALLDVMMAFDHERIPERVVHAKGAGAFGFFEVTTSEMTKYCKAKIFSEVGKKTDMAVRFSTVSGNAGSPDTARDPRGFAMKFYTEEGNWDLVGNNTPIFFIRDPILFPSFIHSQKRNPVTNLKDMDMFWDFLTLRPESIQQVLFLFSDRGIPDGYRYMNGYGSHTFKTINADGVPYYVKWHIKSEQGIKTLSPDKAIELAAVDADYATRDLYEAIHQGEYPSWKMYIQVMTFDQAEKMEEFNPFDLTKVWPHGDFPLIEIGRIILNQTPQNYFSDIEQLAFSVSAMPPGIMTSPDKMLQARMFSYTDTHLHRLGVNYLNIPVNKPRNTVKVASYNRDGMMRVDDNGKGTPNYWPNSFSGPTPDPTLSAHHAASYAQAGKVYHAVGDVSVARYETGNDDNFSQAKVFFNKVLDPDHQQRLAFNLAQHLKLTQEFIQLRALSIFREVDEKLAELVKMNWDQVLSKKLDVDWNKLPSPCGVTETLSPPMMEKKGAAQGEKA